MEMGGLPDTEWLSSDHTPGSDVQPVGSCASEPCDGCACLYLRPDAEGTFSNTEQTTETTTCPPHHFLRVKIHVFWLPLHYWLCLCSSRRYHCWKQLELSNSTGQGSGNHLWLGLDLVFQFLSDVGHCADTCAGGTDTCLVTSPVCLLSQWGWVRGLPGFVYLWVKKKNQKAWWNRCIANNVFLSFLVKNFS